jgi:putative NADH-flavin reductase
MHITVFGANSITGKQLIIQALAKGWQVTAYDRDISSLIDKDLRTDELHAIKGYAFDHKGVSEALKNADAVVSLIGGGLDGVDHSRSLGNKNIIQQMEAAGIQRIIVLGGYGILDAGDRYILDTPDYPVSLQALGAELLRVYHSLQASSLNWTIVCPENIIDEDGNRQYLAADDQMPDAGKPGIAAGDLADFILQAISSDIYLKKRAGITRR